jgi:hypothetical protein
LSVPEPAPKSFKSCVWRRADGIGCNTGGIVPSTRYTVGRIDRGAKTALAGPAVVVVVDAAAATEAAMKARRDSGLRRSSVSIGVASTTNEEAPSSPSCCPSEEPKLLCKGRNAMIRCCLLLLVDKLNCSEPSHSRQAIHILKTTPFFIVGRLAVATSLMFLFGGSARLSSHSSHASHPFRQSFLCHGAPRNANNGQIRFSVERGKCCRPVHSNEAQESFLVDQSKFVAIEWNGLLVVTVCS